MMDYSLVPHPDFPPAGVRAVTVALAVRGDVITLRYRVDPALTLVLPSPVVPRRTDGLWRTTCFELFLKPTGGPRYIEYNFSPSRAWAAYAFDDYRDGMRVAADIVAPVIDRIDDGVAVECQLGNLGDGAVRIALTAVIEETGGVRSFWSLAHPPGAPDFHHDACFVATLPPRTPA